jgi:subtilisin family serine protease
VRLRAALVVTTTLLTWLPSPASSAPTDAFAQVVVSFDTAQDPGDRARALVQASGGRVDAVHTGVLDGATLSVPLPAVAWLMKAPGVVFVEPNQPVRTVTETQVDPPWGLDRIDQRALPLDASYGYGTTGTGVRAYVVDSGIRSSHQDFIGRLAPGATTIDDGRGTDDCDGHGTHVAGTLGGSTFGVAKGVTLVPVRVLDCDGNGYVSGVVAAINWIAAQEGAMTGPAVANLSLGTTASDILDAAVAGLIDTGVTAVVAAGNDGADACGVSPARVREAVTVGATSTADARAGFSNRGACVDLFAPGAAITSAGHLSDSAAATMSGTSMAAPHVAGVVARMLESAPLSPRQTADELLGMSTAGALADVAGSPDRLLFAPSTVEGSAVDGFVPLSPVRAVDTTAVRSPSTSLVRLGLTNDELIAAGVPTTGVRALALNVKVFAPSANGYLAVYPCDTTTTASRVSSATLASQQTTQMTVIAGLSAPTATSHPDSVCIQARDGGHRAIATDRMIVYVTGWSP